MRYLLLLFTGSVFFFTGYAQQKFSIHQIKLPAAIAYYDNQFSGMYIHDDALFLMSESRLQDKAEAVLYSIKLKDLDQYKADTNYTLPYQKHPVIGLDILRSKMKKEGQDYEGLEAIVMKDNTVYLSVETATPSAYCYLLKGRLNTDGAVIMDTTILQDLRKPTRKSGEHIYNAGFEAVAYLNNKLYTFFEYNYFDEANYAYYYDTALNNTNKHAVPFADKLPFRITDITQTGKDHFTAINYFYIGTGGDEVYRLPAADAGNTLIKDSTGYKNYVRLIDIEVSDKKVKWKPLFEFPPAFSSYNWEGIAAYKDGYFIINDKYTPKKPYASVLLYLQKER